MAYEGNGRGVQENDEPKGARVKVAADNSPESWGGSDPKGTSHGSSGNGFAPFDQREMESPHTNKVNLVEGNVVKTNPLESAAPITKSNPLSEAKSGADSSGANPHIGTVNKEWFA